MRHSLVPVTTRLVMLAIGFAGGICTLSILTAPLAPDTAALQHIATETLYAGRLARNLKGFLPIKDESLRVGDVKTFNGFIGELPAGIDARNFTAVFIWCEAFDQFISAAGYQAAGEVRK